MNTRTAIEDLVDAVTAIRGFTADVLAEFRRRGSRATSEGAVHAELRRIEVELRYARSAAAARLGPVASLEGSYAPNSR